MEWVELGDRCWVRRWAEWDLNTGVVAGSDGVLVIDTRATVAQATELLESVRHLTPGPIRWVVNTHAHFDHTFGNSVFTDAEIYAHENAAEALRVEGPALQERYRRGPDPEYPGADTAEIAAAPIVLPTQDFAAAKVIDLGDRRVELLHLGNGHTSGDAVVVVPDVDVLFTGDLIEESAPPSYGEDSFPLEWPDTADRLAGLLTETTRLVPGHGAVVDKDFVQEQVVQLGTIANTISSLHHSGASLETALAHDDWPYPPDHLHHAIRRGYHHLGTTRRPLPLA